MRFSRLCLLPALLGLFLVAAAKKPGLSLAVHPEANQSDGEPFAMPAYLAHAKRQAFIGRMPLFTERDVNAIYSFPAADGTMGCAFYLGSHGRALFDAHTVERRGTSIVVVFNGRQVIDLVVDKRIADGLFVVPSGLTPEEIALLEKRFPTKSSPPKAG